ncbi:FMN-dependent alpha-hydroxy acid dehydrogenase [Epithele typhae]|uniref:FMN-dependent alpha-hydroxy acid dehydrogenase n=1 Tax=Epithele typhae TaxID=378194 RepID=UPI00200751FA|nr:FMN-dependent alpha-hydroxy acid dehydrogenase [Epithele typhae]KAH9939345.1 FMN-dependent alpha-hydroxy acid dehydrogenase [Epithele typhae]
MAGAAATKDMKSYGSAPGKWSAFARELLATRKRPLLGSVDPSKFEEKAREKLKDYPDSFNFVFGYAGTGETYRANRNEFARWQIVPRMLRDVTHRDLSTTLFGVTYATPLLIAPIGCQTVMHADAECATARAAGALGIPLVLSGAASRSLEQVAEANGPGSHRWFQLYWPLNEDITLSLLSRTKQSGYSALVITVDTMAIGWRYLDLDSGYLPFAHGLGIQIALSDPKFMELHGAGAAPHTDESEILPFPYDPAEIDKLVASGDAHIKEMMRLAAAWGSEAVNGTFRTWQDVRFLRKHWEGPLVVKGILSPEDAEIAIDEGIDGIIVSNHGGRQIDGSISSLYALERIMQSPIVKSAQASNKFAVLMDGGIRSGADMLRAIALGAQAVLLGRTYAYGLAIAGQEGVEAVIKTILAEFELSLGLAGHKSVADICGKAGEVTIKVG